MEHTKYMVTLGNNGVSKWKMLAKLHCDVWQALGLDSFKNVLAIRTVTKDHP